MMALRRLQTLKEANFYVGKQTLNMSLLLLRVVVVVS